MFIETGDFTASVGTYQGAVRQALDEMAEKRVIHRIWDGDYSVWKPEPQEIANRLGWLRIAQAMRGDLSRLEGLAEAVRREGYTHAVLLGMGGSSLAPEVFRQSLGVKAGFLDLSVLDSTVPGAVLDLARRLNPQRTLFIVASKSGGTVETLSFFKFFYNWTVDSLGDGRAGEHFVAITDPGSRLEAAAQRLGFRAAFLNDPNIGGRYSALSYFGLVPAALIGADLALLLERGLEAAAECGVEIATEENLGACLGAILGELAKAGREKLTLLISHPVASFGDWVEQLVAESTGKEGKGILPVVGEPLEAPDLYGDDRLFVYLRLSGDDSYDDEIELLEAAGHPVVRLRQRDTYDLGAMMFLWEMATAVAGHRLGINPFNQPNVEAAKALARQMMAEYEAKGALPGGTATSPSTAAIEAFVEQGRTAGERRNYIAIQAYVQPTAETDAALSALRTRLRDRYRLATTVGYGPRFLHSTGQLHKGDAGNGLFIQFTAEDAHDVAIPAEAGSAQVAMSFGVLKTAQALGDYQALLDAGRQAIRFHIEGDAGATLKRLAAGLG